MSAKVRNGDGVYGLRRAFVLAGAESLLMSLWPVSDTWTERQMRSYYQHLTLGKGRGDSLRLAQLGMLARNPRLHPFYWANFIQSGDWTAFVSPAPTRARADAGSTRALTGYRPSSPIRPIE